MEKRHAQIPLGGIFGEPKVLGNKRIVETQFIPQQLPFGRCNPLAHHVPDRIADLAFNGKPHQADNQHDEEGLGDASNDKSKHIISFPILTRINRKQQIINAKIQINYNIQILNKIKN